MQVQSVPPYCRASWAAEPSLGDSCVTSEHHGSLPRTCCSPARGHLQFQGHLSTECGLPVRAGAGRAVGSASTTMNYLLVLQPHADWCLRRFLPADEVRPWHGTCWLSSLSQTEITPSLSKYCPAGCPQKDQSHNMGTCPVCMLTCGFCAAEQLKSILTRHYIKIYYLWRVPYRIQNLIPV